MCQYIHPEIHVLRSGFEEFRKTRMLNTPFERFETLSESLNFMEYKVFLGLIAKINLLQRSPKTWMKN